jgi:hypothetical protein
MVLFLFDHSMELYLLLLFKIFISSYLNFDDHSLPPCSQNGIVPSLKTKCGPLKLNLYSNRLRISGGVNVNIEFK